MEYKCNVPVALIFFARPDTFAKVFEAVRKAQPKQLFLIQDGPREGNEEDIKRIKECRIIADNIDWECEVKKNYSEKNLGCGMRPASGISWVFKHVEEAIILEDDCVPQNSFFRYCEDMLEKYKNDERICYISGLNHFESWDSGESDYFFAKTGAIWGWATWGRIWNQYYDYYVSSFNNKYIKSLVVKQIENNDISKSRQLAWENANKSKETGEILSYWDAQWGFVKYSQNMLVVVPKYNQISNIGVGVQSTHAQKIKTTKYKKYKTFFYIPTQELIFPLKHPSHCICDSEYDYLVNKSMLGNKFRRTIVRFVKKIMSLYGK